MRVLVAMVVLALIGCAEERPVAAQPDPDILAGLPAARQIDELENLIVWLGVRQAAFRRKTITLRVEMHDIDETQQLILQPEFDNGVVAAVIRKEAASILKEDRDLIVALEAGIKTLGDQIEVLRARVKRLRGNKL